MWLSWISHTYLVPSERTTPAKELKSEWNPSASAYLFYSVSTSMPAPWGPSASACAMCEQLVKRRVSRARSLSLCGMATVVVPYLGPPPNRPR